MIEQLFSQKYTEHVRNIVILKSVGLINKILFSNNW